MSEPASHILVPTDFGPAARDARQLAFQLAMRSEARVTMLHVSERLTQLEPCDGFDAIGHLHTVLHLQSSQTTCTPSFTSGPDSERKSALDRLQREVHPEWRGAVNIRNAWRQGAIVPEILAFIQEAEVDTLVLGAPIRRWRLAWSPSVTEQLLKAAPCRTILVNNPQDSPLPALRLPALLNGLATLWKRPAVRLSGDG